MSDLAAPPRPLSPVQIELIGQSFALVFCKKAEFAKRVYDRFFVLEPEARALFQSNLTRQRAKITQALSLTVRAMSSQAELELLAERLARSHLRYRIGAREMGHMAKAILAAFDDCLGAAFTPDMRGSWQAAFDRFLPMFLSAQAKLEGGGLTAQAAADEAAARRARILSP
ncbi:globin domain-containing protein [Nioella nitratireducens]|uniref:globin domain-containing protein n=1 Tax=Nioella nitratireducens TaxID=1287720 RepID=UPI0008FD4ACD|nr:globin domain-containing protein [Nioella nitratireducens]